MEPLDSTRIHPETYDWARKMAVDALEYDDTAEDANPAGALEEILDSPDRLKDLDLDAFAVELERQVHVTASHWSVSRVGIMMMMMMMMMVMMMMIKVMMIEVCVCHW